MTRPDPTHERDVVAGVDTHSLTHHVAVLDAVNGRVLGDREVPATQAGYRETLEFVAGFGNVVRWGIEGTNSYGAGLTRHLTTAGEHVCEVIRPQRNLGGQRRLHGKSDPLDALAAAREAMHQGMLPVPKSSTGPVEAIRVLLLTRTSALKAHGDLLRQIAMILVSAPAALREALQPLGSKDLMRRLQNARPGQDPTVDIETTTMIALRNLAQRHRHLEEEITTTTTMLRVLVQQAAPSLLAAYGLGVMTAAQLLVTVGDNHDRIRSKAAFAALCGVSPVPASSGRTHRHRLNRGGDRQANKAIHQIALVRMAWDERTKAYIAKKKTEGKSTREAMRCLKRHIANELFTLITNPPPVPDVSDLRPARKARGLTLTTAAQHLGVHSADLSNIERATRRNDDLANTYRQWLNTA